MDNLIEEVELRVVAPKTDLTALDQALAKLQAFQAAIDGINAKLAGLSTNSAFKRTQAGIEDSIKQLQKVSGKNAPLKDVSEALGFDPKDVNQFRLRSIEDLEQQIGASEKKRTGLRGKAHEEERKDLLSREKKLQAELSALRATFQGQDLRLSGASSGAKFYYKYQKSAIKESGEPIEMLQHILGSNAQTSSPPQTSANGPAAMGKVTVPASQIEALLGPGAITLTIPPSRIQTASAATGNGHPAQPAAPGELVPAVTQAPAAPPQEHAATAAVPPVPLQPSAQEPPVIPPAKVSVENVLPANAPHPTNRRVATHPLTAEQQLWRNAARQLASSSVELGKVPGQWTDAERSWITKNVSLEGIPPEQIQGLTSRIVRAARMLRRDPSVAPAPSSRLRAPEPVLPPVTPKVEVPPAIVQPNRAPEVSVAAPTVNVAGAEAPVIQLPAIAPAPKAVEETKSYRDAYAKAQAGGMNATESHEFAKDQASRALSGPPQGPPQGLVARSAPRENPASDTGATFQMEWRVRKVAEKKFYDEIKDTEERMRLDPKNTYALESRRVDIEQGKETPQPWAYPIYGKGKQGLIAESMGDTGFQKATSLDPIHALEKSRVEVLDRLSREKSELQKQITAPDKFTKPPLVEQANVEYRAELKKQKLHSKAQKGEADPAKIAAIQAKLRPEFEARKKAVEDQIQSIDTQIAETKKPSWKPAKPAEPVPVQPKPVAPPLQPGAWGTNTTAEEKVWLQKIAEARRNWKRVGDGPIYPPLEAIGITKQQFNQLKKKDLVEDRGFGHDIKMAGSLEIDPALRESLASIGKTPPATTAESKAEPKLAGTAKPKSAKQVAEYIRQTTGADVVLHQPSGGRGVGVTYSEIFERGNLGRKMSLPTDFQKMTLSELAAQFPAAKPPIAATPPAPQAPVTEPVTAELLHGSPLQGLKELKAGTMMTSNPAWAAGYTTKTVPDMAANRMRDEFVGSVYKSKVTAHNPIYAPGLHEAEGKLISLAESVAPGKAQTLEQAAKLVSEHLGHDAILVKKGEEITGAIPLKPTAVSSEIAPRQALAGFQGHIPDNIKEALTSPAIPETKPALTATKQYPEAIGPVHPTLGSSPFPAAATPKLIAPQAPVATTPPPPAPPKPPVAAPAPAAPGGNGKGTSSSVPLVVASSRIAATLGPGDVRLVVPPGRIAATIGAPTAAAPSALAPATPSVPPGAPVLPPSVPPAAPAAPSGPTVPPVPPSAGTPPPLPPSGPPGKLLEEKITTKAGSVVATQRRELIRSGQTIDKFEKAVKGVMEPTKEVTTISPLKAATQKLQEQVASVKSELQEQLAGPTPQPPKVAALYRKQAAVMRSFVETSTTNPQTGEKEVTPTPAAKQLQSLGQGQLISRTKAQAAKLEQQATLVEARAEAARQKELGQEMRKTGQVREVLHKAKLKGEQAEAARQDEEKANFERQVASQNKMLAAGQKSDEKKQAAQRKVSERDTLREQARVHKAASEQEADVRLGDFLQSGGRIKRTERQNELRPGSPRRVVAEREAPGGQVETMVVTYGKAEASVAKFTKAQSEARKEGGYLAGDFIKNTAKVTLWAASVGILYKSLELVTHSIGRLIAIGPQMGRLEQIFKGVGGTAHQVALDTLEMAAQMGASDEQAMEAAIQWARLALSRVEINEAVRQSLIAANVAQIDALEATEKLQGVMKAYGLSVGDLRGELGQIVAVTNTYNVTTEDMLTGLSRVAAVAKQAGLPLAELHGLLGATIGGTAQSGANIGNMLKSVILALSNPDLQNKLRMNFKFEATTGGEEIKGMSALIGDLFVKFQHLNQLQQQSMLFSVAGRTQASRLQALLEGYVKAQVLAVNAQLHLNTAEQENTKITATLKAQLHGVAAEWERFIFVQGNRGPVQAMTEMATAMRNVLKLMNTPIGGAATTGILGLLAAGGIKSIVTGMALKSGGFLSRSGAHISSALGEFNNSMMAVYAGAMQGGLATNVATRRQQIIGARSLAPRVADNIGMATLLGPTGGRQGSRMVRMVSRGFSPSPQGLGFGNFGFDTVAGLKQPGMGLDARMYVWSEAMLRVGRSSAVSSVAVRGMATALGSVTRALGVGFIALRQFMLPIAIIGATMYAFNRAVEAVGASSEKAERKLAGFNDQAQAAAAAANAYAEAAQAITTIERAIQPESGFRPIKTERQKELIDQSSELFGLYEPDLNKQQGIQRSLKAQMDLMLQQGNLAGVLNIMESERNKLVDARARKLQEEYVHIQAQRKSADDEIKRLKAINDSPVRGFFGKTKRAENITQKEKEVQELSMSSTRNLTDQTRAYEEHLQYDEKYQGDLRTQKLLWESIGEIYQSVNANNPIERAQNKIASLKAQDQAIEHHFKMLDEEDKNDIEARAGVDQRKAELKVEEETTRKELDVWMKRKQAKDHPKMHPGWPFEKMSDIRENLKTTSSSTEGIDSEIRKRQEALQINERLVKDAEAGHGAGKEAERFAARGALRTADTERRREIRGDIEAETRNLPVAEVQTRMEFGREQARRETAPFAVGRDETQKLQNLNEGIRKVLMGLQEMPQSAEVLSREIDLQNQRYEAQIALRNRSMTLERDILQLQIDQRKEMEHSILGAGPAEMLRKLAALRMGSNGKMNMGQFLSLSPEMRRDVAMVDTRFDPRMIDLQRERRRYTRQPEEDFERGLRETSAAKQDMVDRVQQNVPELSTYKAAAKAVNDFAGELGTASAAVRNFSEKLDAVLTQVNAGRKEAAAATVGMAPRNPQSGGVGAGAGFMPSAIMRGGD